MPSVKWARRAGTASPRKALLPVLRSIRLTWTWQPQPAMSVAGLDMKVARYPARCASSLMAFLKVKALSAPARPRPGPKLISNWEGEYSQLWVMTSIPAAWSWSSRVSRKGT